MRRFRWIVALFCFPLVLVLLTRVVYPWAARLRSVAVPFASTTPKPINVLEIRYYPSDRDAQEAKTQALSDGLVAAMSDASKYHAYKDGSATKYAQVVIKRSIERDRNSPNTTGSYPTYYHSMDTMLTGDGENLCDYIVDNNIDQVWFWKHVGDGTADSGGFNLEYYRVWSTALFPVQSPPALCGGRRSFLVLGLDQDRLTQEALHSFGHSTESLISSIEGSDLFWTKFAGTSHQICGNVHYPPNGIVDYDYTIATVSATTSCEDWHPDGSGATTSISCTRWSCDELEYLKWWFQNMPNEGNTFSYQSKMIPNWWDFQSETDTALSNAVSSGKYISPYFIDAYRTAPIDSVSGAAAQSGTTLSLTHTVSGANRLFLLGASYRSPSKSTTISGNEQITAVSLNGVPLTRVNRTIYHEYVTELWYLTNPSVGTQTVSVTFATGVQDEVVGGISFTGIDQTNPFDTINGHQAGTASFTTNPTISIPSSTAQTIFGVVAMYTGDNNELGVSGSSNGVWGVKTTNVIGKAALATGGPSSGLSWESLASWPWSMSAVVLNPAPATSTPSQSASVGPTCNSECTQNNQCPSDLICASGRCRRPGCTALDTCSCGPSCNSNCHQNSDCPSDLICASELCRRPGCTAVDTCSCGSPTPATATPVASVNTKQQASQIASSVFRGKLTVNGLDSANYPFQPPAHITVPVGSTPRLVWTTNSRGCIASGGWSGKKAASGSQRIGPMTTKTLFKLLCTMPNGRQYPLSAAVYMQ